MDLSLFQDIGILLLLAASVLLFLSNLHVCGNAGEVAFRFQKGSFGIFGYIAPIWFFISILFVLVNHKSGKAVVRAILSYAILAFLCGLVQLIAMDGFDPGLTAGDYYKLSLETNNGGMIGGMIVKVLYPRFGIIGSGFVLLFLCMVAGVIVTQKSILKPIEENGKRAYDTAKAEMKLKAEERREQRELEAEHQKELRAIRAEKHRAELEARRKEELEAARMERKVQGVTTDTLILDESDTSGVSAISVKVPVEELKENKNTKKKASEKEAEEKKKGTMPKMVAPVPKEMQAAGGMKEIDPYGIAEEASAAAENTINPADFFVGEIHGMNGGKDRQEMKRNEEDEFLIEDEEEIDLSSIREDRTPLRAEKVKEESYVVPEAPKAESMTTAKPERERLQKPVQELEREPIYERMYDPEMDDIPVNAAEDTPEIGAYDAVEQPVSEVRTVISGNGKVIEIEVDPTEPDPIQAKLAKQRGESSIFRDPGKARDGSGATRFTDLTGREENITQTIEPKVELPKKVVKPPRPYVKPPKGLMKKGNGEMKNRDDELRETAVKLQQTLQNFNVGVKVTNISCGPSVTRYELTPEQGVKVSRIVSLQDDIKLSLAAADIRIEAPIPGKSAVGIEVPNRENMTVWLRDVLESPEFERHPSKLAFGVGRDIAGNIVVTDLAKMPHLLIAGATGSGKSVCINTLIMSIIYKADPKEVRLIMVDPKVVELSIYNGIPHLMIPVVTDPKKAAGALNWAVSNMTDRYKKFAEKNVRDLRGYNEKIKEELGDEAELLPQIVIIVDELADLMMVAPGEVEDAICRLAQMARAAGIHLVLATQRPSVNVITGLIKANVPSRIAFSVSSGVDSRTIIDMVGAEKLLGKGDMLFYPSGFQKPARVQGAFVSDEEVSAVVKFLTDRSDASYSEELENSLVSSGSADSGFGGGNGGGNDTDPYFADAGRFIIEKEKGSIGMLQRAFKIGFNRAARIMDQLAEANVVGEEEGTKPRKVLMTLEEFNELIGGR